MIVCKSKAGSTSRKLSLSVFVGERRSRSWLYTLSFDVGVVHPPSAEQTMKAPVPLSRWASGMKMKRNALPPPLCCEPNLCLLAPGTAEVGEFNGQCEAVAATASAPLQGSRGCDVRSEQMQMRVFRRNEGAGGGVSGRVSCSARWVWAFELEARTLGARGGIVWCDGSPLLASKEDQLSHHGRDEERRRIRSDDQTTCSSAIGESALTRACMLDVAGTL